MLGLAVPHHADAAGFLILHCGTHVAAMFPLFRGQSSVPPCVCVYPGHICFVVQPEDSKNKAGPTATAPRLPHSPKLTGGAGEQVPFFILCVSNMFQDYNSYQALRVYTSLWTLLH